MKRLCISIVILTSVTVMASLSVFALHQSDQHLFELVDRTAEAYRTGEDTKQRLEELEDYWQDHYLLMTYITASSTMEDMSRSVAKLPYLLESGSDDFLAELESVKHWAQLVYDSQFPDLSSIF